MNKVYALLVKGQYLILLVQTNPNKALIREFVFNEIISDLKQENFVLTDRLQFDKGDVKFEITQINLSKL